MRIAAAVARAMAMPLSVVELRVPTPPPAIPPAGEASVALPAPSVLDDDLMEPAHDVDDLLRRCGAEAASRRVRLGEPSEQLRTLAAEQDTAVLVVLDSGGGAAESWLSGDPVRRDLHELSCPAIVVPSSFEAAEWKPEVVIALARRDWEGSGVSAHAARLSLLLNAHLRIEQELTEPPRGSLIVVAAPARGPLASALTGSAVHRLLAEQVAPVVVVPANAHAGRERRHRAA